MQCIDKKCIRCKNKFETEIEDTTRICLSCRQIKNPMKIKLLKSTKINKVLKRASDDIFYFVDKAKALELEEKEICQVLNRRKKKPKKVKIEKVVKPPKVKKPPRRMTIYTIRNIGDDTPVGVKISKGKIENNRIMKMNTDELLDAFGDLE